MEYSEKLKSLNDKYDEIINASYLNKFLTSKAQKNNECNKLIEEYKNILTDEKIENDVKREIYIHLINLYSEISNSQELILTKSKLYSIFSEEEFKEHLKNKSETEINELLNVAELSEKDKYYIYLIEDRKLNKYIEEYVNSKCTNIKKDYVKIIFEKYLGTPEAKKYGELLITKYEDKEYVLETDPLISNLDRYKEL